MQMSAWKSTAGNFPVKLPKLAFPLKRSMPKLYKPQRTLLRMTDDSQTHAYLWCYLERKANGKRYLFNPSSLSAQRVVVATLECDQRGCVEHRLEVGSLQVLLKARRRLTETV